jgi:hypothetical protein
MASWLSSQFISIKGRTVLISLVSKEEGPPSPMRRSPRGPSPGTTLPPAFRPALSGTPEVARLFMMVFCMVAQQFLIEKNKAIRLRREVYYKTTFSEFFNA